MRRLASCAVLLVLLLGAGGTGAAAVGGGVTVVSNGPRSIARVALTFDDGVSPANCRRILAILTEKGAPATFFPVASLMRLDPAFWRLVVAAGDPIGNHSLSHPQLPRLTPAAQFTQIDEARRVAETVTGEPLLRVFRPPYGAYTGVTLAAAQRAGFPTVLLWDTSDRDTSQHGTVAQMLAAAERARNGSVVLLHCGPDATPYLLGSLIDSLRARGLRLVTVPDLLGLHWASSPRRPAPTVAEILGGLSPLPPAPSGGPIIGPDGLGSMSPEPSSPTPAPSQGPAASSSASSSPSSPAPSTPAASPGTVSSAPTGSSPPSAAPSATSAPTPVAAEHGDLVSDDRVGWIGLAAVVLAAALVVVGVVRARRGGPRP